MISISLRARYLGVVAGATLLAVGGSGAAHAVPAYAYANLEFQNFTLTGVVGNPSVTINSTSVLLTDSANYPASAPASNAANGNLLSGADVAQATSGPGPFPGENVFTQQLTASSGTRGDGLITGPISGAASSNLVAEGRLTTIPTAGSSAGSGTTITAAFTVLDFTTVTLSFDAIAHLFTSVGQVGDTATAQISASYTIVDSLGNSVPITGYQAAFNALNLTRSSQIPGVNGVYDLTGTPSNPDFTLIANLAPGTYTLTFSDSATEILQTVPEPGTLALLGSGLLALGLLAQRRTRMS